MKPGRKDRLERKIEWQDFKLNALLEVTRAINEQVEPELLIARYKESLSENLGIDRLVLYAKEEDWTCLLATGVIGKVPVVQDQDFFAQPDGVRFTSSLGEEQFDVVVPVMHDGQAIAYLLAGETEEGRGVSPVVKHLHFIQTLTNVLIVALRNRQLTEQSIKQEAARRELELAAEMQAMLVPEGWPEDPDVEIKAHYKPHQEVGGDYYDVFPVDDRRLAFCMADVSGKGVSAAFLMSNFQANLRAIFQYEPDDLEGAIRKLNERVMENAQGEKYITLFAAIYDRKSRKLSYVNCGHNPPVLMEPDGRAKQLSLGSVGLGMFREIPSVQSGSAQVQPGSFLVCYTDGLVEQENMQGIPYGMTRMENLLKTHRGMGPQEIVNALLEAVEVFRDEEPTFDDTALMITRFN
jgi:phosphoserine phosphatase RsbU/P